MSDSEPTMADAKGALAQHGIDVSPDAKLQVVSLDPKAKGYPVIVLDRTRPDWLPPYCIHGYTACVHCEHPVYLGSASVEKVRNGTLPLCRECGAELVPPGTAPMEQVGDHLRADGPHD